MLRKVKTIEKRVLLLVRVWTKRQKGRDTYSSPSVGKEIFLMANCDGLDTL